ncbi:MAG: hypothetical protein B6242_07790 [Anaerolineaceae bacterium 4572_78]|nr:MAG: hypothetical protein B6242_07790 [Anaerolineaceae bacterium 4572_78]
MFTLDNLLFKLASSGKRVPPIWLVIPLAWVVLLISSFGGAIAVIIILILRLPKGTNLAEMPTNKVAALAMPQSNFEQFLFLVTAFGGVYLVLWLWLRFAEERPFSTLGFLPQDGLFNFVRGLVVGFVIFSIPIGCMAIAGYYALQPFSLSSMIAVMGGVTVIFLGWVVQGSAEEVIFRGWVFPVVSVKSNVYIGIIVSSLLFAFGHIFNSNLSILAMVNLTLFGIFATVYAMYEEGLWGICAIHAVWNWTQGNIYGLEVSGNRISGGSLLVLDETGPDIITGGLFGPEGGLAVSLMLCIGIAVISWLGLEKKA